MIDYDVIEVKPEGALVVPTVYRHTYRGVTAVVDFINKTIWRRGWSQAMCRRWAKVHLRE